MINLNLFKGEMPRVQPRALPNEASVSAVNCRLLSGGLEAWKDIASVFLLGKAGPTTTIYPYYDGTDVLKWFSWAASELQNGATEVNVARIPIANDTTYRTVFTGTGKPQITNVALALGGGTSPNGPYPIDSIDLGVVAPDAPPTVQNIPGTSANNVTTTLYNTQMTGWATGNTGSFGSVTSISSGGHPTIPYPCYDFLAQQNGSTYASISGNFGTGTCISFVAEYDTSSTDGSDLVEDQNVFFQILSDGNGATAQGAELQILFTGSGGGVIQWVDKGAGSSPVVLSGTVSATTPVHVKTTAVNNGLDPVTNIRTFTCEVVVTNATTHAVIATSSGLVATFCGDNLYLGGTGGDNAPDAGHVYFGRISMVVSQPPNTLVPVFSNYLYTRANSLLLESGPSPPSTPSVQVDNDNINIVTIPVPPGGESDAEFFLYRVATGASGAQYLQVENGAFADGGFPLAVATGTGNAVILTTQDGAAPAQDASYFAIATATNTSGVTAALNGNSAAAVLDESGAALGAAAIVSGNPYTFVYNRKVVQAAGAQTASGIAIIPMTDTTGIQNGQVVTDAVGAVPPGTTVSSFVAGVSVTLSQPITTAITAGVLFFFANTSNTYTLLAGFVYRDATPTADLGNPLQSTDWDPPPDDMIGIIALPNEILAGFVGNTLCLSVPGQPQAWPIANQLATDSPIVALVALGFNIGILTQGHPYTAYGTDPSAFQMGVESFPQGCMSARSTAYSRLYGGIYASTDGVYAYSGFGEIKNLTDALFTKREWDLLNPSTITGCVHQGLYFFWYETAAGAKAGKILDMTTTNFGLVSLDFHAIAVTTDSSDDSMFMVLDAGTITGGGTTANNELTEWEGASTYRHGSWTSKIYQNPYQIALMLERIRAGNYTGLTTTLYVDGVATPTRTPLDKNEFTIEPWKGNEHQLAIAWSNGSTNPAVQTAQIVERAEELA